MPMSDRTRAEIEAGAKALALHQGMGDLPAGYMEAMVRTHDRNLLLRRWETDCKLTIERVVHYSGQSHSDGQPVRESYLLYHVTKGPTFDDRDAEKVGASPSEVLIAHIALALQAQGEL